MTVSLMVTVTVAPVANAVTMLVGTAVMSRIGLTAGSALLRIALAGLIRPARRRHQVEVRARDRWNEQACGPEHDGGGDELTHGGSSLRSAPVYPFFHRVAQAQALPARRIAGGLGPFEGPI